jgi:hypothetical protein
MHLHLVPVAARPAQRAEVKQRPAKVVTLEARRQARLQAAAPRPPKRAA